MTPEEAEFLRARSESRLQELIEIKAPEELIRREIETLDMFGGLKEA